MFPGAISSQNSANLLPIQSFGELFQRFYSVQQQSQMPNLPHVYQQYRSSRVCNRKDVGSFTFHESEADGSFQPSNPVLCLQVHKTRTLLRHCLQTDR